MNKVLCDTFLVASANFSRLAVSYSIEFVLPANPDLVGLNKVKITLNVLCTVSMPTLYHISYPFKNREHIKT